VRLATPPFAHGVTSPVLRQLHNLQSCCFRPSTSAYWQPDNACPTNNVRIHASYVGGGFGGKSFCKMEPLVVLLAMKSARPVRCVSAWMKAS